MLFPLTLIWALYMSKKMPLRMKSAINRPSKEDDLLLAPRLVKKDPLHRLYHHLHLHNHHLLPLLLLLLHLCQLVSNQMLKC